MTEEQYLEFCKCLSNASAEMCRQAPVRLGQALMNNLCSIDNVTYGKIIGTDADCFYVDKLIGKFFDRLHQILVVEV